MAAPEENLKLQALFKAGIAGDTASYALFLHKVMPVLRKLVIRKISIDDTDDVLQEILVSIHKARHTYDGDRPVIPWLFAIAQFRIKDYWRKTYAGLRYETVDIHDIAEILADVTIRAPGEEYIREVLAIIPEREQRILTLMHVEGFTAKETGEKLGMRESAVKVAAHRAIKKIREQFA